MKMCSEIIIDQHYKELNPVQFGYEACSPGHSYGPAVRTHWLLHYVVSGYGTFERGGQTYSVSPGKIFVIQPYEETFYKADQQQPWSYIWVGFTAGVELPETLQQPVLRCAGAGSLFEEMKHCRDFENGRSAFLAGKLWELLALLQEQTEQQTDYVEKAIHFMRSEYMLNITVQGLADRLNLDRCYFSVLFKERTGVPPVRYLMQLRMEKAAELMVAYGERASTAGASVGYPDLYQFSKAFKSHFGLSPRDYVKANKK